LKVAFLGATKGIGRSLARLLATRGDTLALLGRSPSDLERSASDLRIRGQGGDVATAVLDLEREETFAPALDEAERALGGLDCVVVTAGLFRPQAELESDTELARRVASVDFAQTLGFCEEARKRLLARGGGSLVVFSSVAGDRPRKTVVIYGAAKAGLSAYLDGLDLAYGGRLKTLLVKPGFVRTGMTAGLKEPPFAAEPEEVARAVLVALEKGRRVVYAPGIWRVVMAVVRSLPRSVLKKASF